MPGNRRRHEVTKKEREKQRQTESRNVSTNQQTDTLSKLNAKGSTRTTEQTKKN